ncbi:MAG: hypothetical protein NZL85_05360, partial [Fimbriimonadales bacterium]|nr:hypothetical protein [Fimbriimonadales bacterium]
PNGAHGYLYATTNEVPDENAIEICGDRGKLCLYNGKLEFWRFEHSIRQFTHETDQMWGSIRAERVEVPIETPPESALRDHPAIIQNFARSILYDEPLIAPGEEGLAVVELINALILSGKRGIPVAIPVDRAAYDSLLAELKAQSRPKTRLREQRETDPNLVR